MPAEPTNPQSGVGESIRARPLRHDSQGTGEPIIMVPGALTGWLSWIPVQEKLAARRRAVRVQPIQNEQGSAGIPGDPDYTYETERESLRLTIDKLGLERPHIMGWSGGGAASLEFALEYPDRVRSLVLVEPVAYWVLEQLGILAREAERVDNFLHSLLGREVTDADLATFLELAGFVESAGDAPSHPNWEKWLPHKMALSWRGERLDHPARSVEDLARYRGPTLLTKGTRSTVVDRRTVDELGELLAHATILEFDGDHAHHLERLDGFVAAVEAHLDGVESNESAEP